MGSRIDASNSADILRHPDGLHDFFFGGPGGQASAIRYVLE